MAGRRRRRTGKLGKVLCAVFACLFLTIISINKFMLEDRLVQAKVKNEDKEIC